jgi:hypothetical protein
MGDTQEHSIRNLSPICDDLPLSPGVSYPFGGSRLNRNKNSSMVFSPGGAAILESLGA